MQIFDAHICAYLTDKRDTDAACVVISSTVGIGLYLIYNGPSSRLMKIRGSSRGMVKFLPIFINASTESIAKNALNPLWKGAKREYCASAVCNAAAAATERIYFIL